MDRQRNGTDKNRLATYETEKKEKHTEQREQKGEQTKDIQTIKHGR